MNKGYYINDDIIRKHYRQYDKLVEKDFTYVNKNDLSVVLPYMMLNADLNEDDKLNERPIFNTLTASFECNDDYELFNDVYKCSNFKDMNRLRLNYERSLPSNQDLKKLVDELLKVKTITYKQDRLDAINNSHEPNHYDLQDHIIREAEKSKQKLKD